MYYKLEGTRCERVDDVLEWTRWFEGTDRLVKRDKVRCNTTLLKRVLVFLGLSTHHEVEVSTVFLGTDHSFGVGPPLLFETLVFGGDLDGEMGRYTTWDEAWKGHQTMVSRVMQCAGQ